MFKRMEREPIEYFHVTPVILDLARDFERELPVLTQNTTGVFEFTINRNGTPIILKPGLRVTLTTKDRYSSYLAPEMGVLPDRNTVVIRTGLAELVHKGLKDATVQLIDEDGRTDTIPFRYEVKEDLTEGAFPEEDERKSFIEKVVIDGVQIVKAAEDATLESLDVTRTTRELAIEVELLRDETEDVKEATEQERIDTEAVRLATDVVRTETLSVKDATELERTATETVRLNTLSAKSATEQATTDTINAKNDTVTATERANTSASNADGATGRANTATGNANTATTNANNAAATARLEADNVKAKGDYAQEQGDYAKEQGDASKEALENGPVFSVNGRTGAVTGMALQEENEQRDFLALNRRHMHKVGVDSYEVAGDRNLLFHFPKTATETIQVRFQKGTDDFIRLMDVGLVRNGVLVQTFLLGRTEKEFLFSVRRAGTTNTFEKVPGITRVGTGHQKLFIDGVEVPMGSVDFRQSFTEAQLVQVLDIKHPQQTAVLGKLYTTATITKEKISFFTSIQWLQAVTVQEGTVNNLPAVTGYGKRAVTTLGASVPSVKVDESFTELPGNADGYGFVDTGTYRDYMVAVQTPSPYRSLRRFDSVAKARVQHNPAEQLIGQTVYENTEVPLGERFTFEGDYTFIRLPNIGEILS